MVSTLYTTRVRSRRTVAQIDAGLGVRGTQNLNTPVVGMIGIVVFASLSVIDQRWSEGKGGGGSLV